MHAGLTNKAFSHHSNIKEAKESHIKHHSKRKAKRSGHRLQFVEFLPTRFMLERLYKEFGLDPIIKSKPADVRSELDAAAEAQKAAEDKAKDATERTARLQADWENFRRRTANERIAERERATEKLVTALLPVVDDIERAIDHARSQELSEDFKQFVDGVDAVHAKLLDVFAHEGVEPIDPKGEAFDPLEHQAVGRVEDASQYDETVNDVYQKGYRMADRILRSAMVTVTYGGEKRPAPEPEAAPEDAAADTAESTEE